tara:strand:- start:24117 stop:25268 length:1152 start_codon:yes stop_codon:yes gene_type:complete
MNLIKIKRLIEVLIKAKFKFNFIKKKKILIYDKLTLREVYKNLNQKDIDFIYTRNEEFNIFVILKTILRFKFDKKSYLKQMISFHNPKIVLTSSEHDLFFYTLKKYFPKVKFCMVQNGSRSKNFDNFDQLKRNREKYEIDYFFLFNKYISKEYKKYIKFKPVIIGSIKNNQNKINKKVQYKRSVLFISQFKPNYVANLNNKKILLTVENDSSFWIENKILPIIKNFCSTNKITFGVLGRYSNKENLFHIEKNYYKKIIKTKFNMHSQNNSNYKNIDKYENILSIDSTLGHETIPRKRKIMFITARKINNQLVSNAMWPKKIKSNSNFFTNKIDTLSIENLLKKNVFLNYKKWEKKNKSFIFDYMPFDFKNKIYQNAINKILVK